MVEVQNVPEMRDPQKSFIQAALSLPKTPFLFLLVNLLLRLIVRELHFFANVFTRIDRMNNTVHFSKKRREKSVRVHFFFDPLNWLERFFLQNFNCNQVSRSINFIKLRFFLYKNHLLLTDL